jgi:methanogenic corrinoid protein MtbC1
LRVILLGADNPLSELAAACSQSKSDAVVLSSSLATVPWLYQGELASVVRQITVPVFMGGSTAVTHQRAVVQAGAIPIGTDVSASVSIVTAHLYNLTL